MSNITVPAAAIGLPNSRRTFLTGLAVLPLASLPALAASSENDRRLLALAEAYEALDREVLAHKGTEDEFDDLCNGYGDIENEMAEIEADSLAGVMVKARLSQIKVLRECFNEEFFFSIADDLVRLFPNGGAA